MKAGFLKFKNEKPELLALLLIAIAQIVFDVIILAVVYPLVGGITATIAWIVLIWQIARLVEWLVDPSLKNYEKPGENMGGTIILFLYHVVSIALMLGISSFFPI